MHAQRSAKWIDKKVKYRSQKRTKPGSSDFQTIERMVNRMNTRRRRSRPREDTARIVVYEHAVSVGDGGYLGSTTEMEFDERGRLIKISARE